MPLSTTPLSSLPSIPLIVKSYTTTDLTRQIHYRYAHPPASVTRKPNPLVFLHKSASSSASYASLLTHYASLGYTCYAPDMPGFGNSFDPSPSDISLIQKDGTRWYCDIFTSFFIEIGILQAINSPTNSENIDGADGAIQKIHIIGHHSGACLALELAVMFPNNIASICLVGPAVMSEEERTAMKEIYFKPFNEPVWDGTHLGKTWDYLRSMGIGQNLELLQREATDHIRAWKGRNLIYGAVWAQDSTTLYASVKPRVMLMCARDDVLWKYFGYVKGLRSDVQAVEVGGGNFELDRDWQGIAGAWTGFIEGS